jgi:hypothetical protein
MAALPCALRQVPALDQQAEFVLAAYKSGQPAALRRFEGRPSYSDTPSTA